MQETPAASTERPLWKHGREIFYTDIDFKTNTLCCFIVSLHIFSLKPLCSWFSWLETSWQHHSVFSDVSWTGNLLCPNCDFGEEKCWTVHVNLCMWPLLIVILFMLCFRTTDPKNEHWQWNKAKQTNKQTNTGVSKLSWHRRSSGKRDITRKQENI